MLSEELFEASAGTARACLASPFVSGLAKGTLDPAVFRRYVAQDAFYLQSFARAYALAAAQCPKFGTFRTFIALVRGVDEELALHTRYADRLGIDLRVVEPLDATLAYTEFLMDTAWHAGLPETIAALTPCMRLYAWLGGELSRDGIPDHAYADWIRTYSGRDFTELADLLDSLLDEHAKDTPSVRSAYTKAMELELGFFESFGSARE